jgi:hypothetical protein
MLESTSIYPMQDPELDQKLAKEAKAIVVLAFRNGPIENLHAGNNVPPARAKSVIPKSPMTK